MKRLKGISTVPSPRLLINLLKGFQKAQGIGALGKKIPKKIPYRKWFEGKAILKEQGFYHSPWIKKQLEKERSIYSKQIFVEKGSDPTHYIGKTKDAEKILFPRNPKVISLDKLTETYGKSVGLSKETIFRDNFCLNEALNFAWRKGYHLVDGGTQYRVVNPLLPREKIGFIGGKEISRPTGATIQRIPGVSGPSSGKIIGHKLPEIPYQK